MPAAAEHGHKSRHRRNYSAFDAGSKQVQLHPVTLYYIGDDADELEAGIRATRFRNAESMMVYVSLLLIGLLSPLSPPPHRSLCPRSPSPLLHVHSRGEQTGGFRLCFASFVSGSRQQAGSDGAGRRVAPSHAAFDAAVLVFSRQWGARAWRGMGQR